MAKNKVVLASLCLASFVAWNIPSDVHACAPEVVITPVLTMEDVPECLVVELVDDGGSYSLEFFNSCSDDAVITPIHCPGGCPDHIEIEAGGVSGFGILVDDYELEASVGEQTGVMQISFTAEEFLSPECEEELNPTEEPDDNEPVVEGDVDRDPEEVPDTDTSENDEDESEPREEERPATPVEHNEEKGGCSTTSGNVPLSHVVLGFFLGFVVMWRQRSIFSLNKQ